MTPRHLRNKRPLEKWRLDFTYRSDWDQQTAMMLNSLWCLSNTLPSPPHPPHPPPEEQQFVHASRPTERSIFMRLHICKQSRQRSRKARLNYGPMQTKKLLWITYWCVFVWMFAFVSECPWLNEPFTHASMCIFMFHAVMCAERHEYLSVFSFEIQLLSVQPK